MDAFYYNSFVALLISLHLIFIPTDNSMFDKVVFDPEVWKVREQTENNLCNGDWTSSIYWSLFKLTEIDL